MATIHRFEDALVWQKAIELGLLVYDKTKHMRDYAFVDQIRRAALSISNNIAEGLERKSGKEKTQFFSIARGSTSEVRSMAIFGERLGHFSRIDMEKMNSLSIEIIKMLSSFMAKIEK